MTSFLELKSKLFASFPSYSIFLQPVEEAAIQRAQEIEVPSYEPLLFELLLKDFIALLDRCLQFRREAMDLEIQAVKAFTDYELFTKNSLIERELEKLALQVESTEAEANGFNNAAQTFGASTDPLAGGMRDEMTTRSRAASLAEMTAKKRVILIDQKHDNLIDYQAAYNARYTTPGNSHNFAERMERVVGLLAEDLAEALAKATAISAGYQMLFGQHFSAPSPTGGLIIDGLVGWARHLMRAVETNSQNETEFSVAIPLTQPWKGKNFDSIIDSGSLKVEIDDKKAHTKSIRFSLKGVFYNQKNTRIRGIDFSFGNRSDTTTNGIRTSDFSLNLLLRATIFTPEVRRPDGTIYRRPPVIIGDVPNFAHFRDKSRDNTLSCFNVSPEGEWTILIEAAAVSDNGDAVRIEDGWFKSRTIRDLKLHLRLVARPDAVVASAFS